MWDFNLKKNPLKIVIVCPQRVGKTVIANSLSEFSNSVSPDYNPKIGVRIFELENLILMNKLQISQFWKK